MSNIVERCREAKLPLLSSTKYRRGSALILQHVVTSRTNVYFIITQYT